MRKKNPKTPQNNRNTLEKKEVKLTMEEILRQQSQINVLQPAGSQKNRNFSVYGRHPFEG